MLADHQNTGQDIFTYSCSNCRGPSPYIQQQVDSSVTPHTHL